MKKIEIDIEYAIAAAGFALIVLLAFAVDYAIPDRPDISYVVTDHVGNVHIGLRWKEANQFTDKYGRAFVFNGNFSAIEEKFPN